MRALGAMSCPLSAGGVVRRRILAKLYRAKIASTLRAPCPRPRNTGAMVFMVWNG